MAGDVRPGETLPAGAMSANLFLLLVLYYLLKGVREPLVLVSGAELKPNAAALQAVVLAAFVPVYAWLASRLTRMRLIATTLAFFVVNVARFHVGVTAEMPFIGVAFFTWVGIFSLVAIAQFCSYANDVYGREEGERLFPVIAIDVAAGSPVGARVAQLLFRAGAEPTRMLQLAAVLLLVHLAIYVVIERLDQARGELDRLFADEHRPPASLAADDPRGEVQGEQAIDTFFVRSGDMVAAGVVFAGNDVAAAQRTGVCHRERRGDSALAGGNLESHRLAAQTLCRLSLNCRRPHKCDTWIVKLERHGGASVRLITVCARCDVGRAIAVSRSPGLGVVRNPPNAPRDVVCVSYVYMMIEPDDARHGR
jgi:hypothetical protein